MSTRLPSRFTIQEEALKWAEPEAVLLSEFAAGSEETAGPLLAAAEDRGVPVLLLDDGAFRKVSTEQAPQGVIAVVRQPEALHPTSGLETWQAGKRLLMLDEVRDPGNLGTILRCAEALGADGVILSGTADLYHPKTVRATMGTLFRFPVFRTDDGAEAVRTLVSAGRRVLGASLDGETLTLGEFEPDPTDVPVIGNEGHGLTQAVRAACSASLRIPMTGETESLNAAAAAACILWEYWRGRSR